MQAKDTEFEDDFIDEDEESEGCIICGSTHPYLHKKHCIYADDEDYLNAGLE